MSGIWLFLRIQYSGRFLCAHSSKSSRNAASKVLAVPRSSWPNCRCTDPTREASPGRPPTRQGFRPALPRLAPHGPNDQRVPLRRHIHIFPQRTLFEQRRINRHQAGPRDRNGLCIHDMNMPPSDHECKEKAGKNKAEITRQKLKR